jgi:hypothetical protein
MPGTNSHQCLGINGDMRGWFGLISGACAEPNPPTCRQFPKKRLKGFEPSTFCMAIRQVMRKLLAEWS